MSTAATDPSTGRTDAPRARSDRGSILPFTATLVAALIGCAGLAVDGGRILAARRDASSIAAAAARRGAEELAWTGLATGHAMVDPDRASAAALAYIRLAGADGQVAATPERVEVTVVVTKPTVLLGAFGVGP